MIQQEGPEEDGLDVFDIVDSFFEARHNASFESACDSISNSFKFTPTVGFEASSSNMAFSSVNVSPMTDFASAMAGLNGVYEDYAQGSKYPAREDFVSYWNLTETSKAFEGIRNFFRKKTPEERNLQGQLTGVERNVLKEKNINRLHTKIQKKNKELKQLKTKNVVAAGETLKSHVAAAGERLVETASDKHIETASVSKRGYEPKTGLTWSNRDATLLLSSLAGDKYVDYAEEIRINRLVNYMLREDDKLSVLLKKTPPSKATKEDVEKLFDLYHQAGQVAWNGDSGYNGRYLYRIAIASTQLYKKLNPQVGFRNLNSAPSRILSEQSESKYRRQDDIDAIVALVTNGVKLQSDSAIALATRIVNDSTVVQNQYILYSLPFLEGTKMALCVLRENEGASNTYNFIQSADDPLSGYSKEDVLEFDDTDMGLIKHTLDHLASWMPTLIDDETEPEGGPVKYTLGDELKKYVNKSVIEVEYKLTHDFDMSDELQGQVTALVRSQLFIADGLKNMLYDMDRVEIEGARDSIKFLSNLVADAEQMKVNDVTSELINSTIIKKKGKSKAFKGTKFVLLSILNSVGNYLDEVAQLNETD